MLAQLGASDRGCPRSAMEVGGAGNHRRARRAVGHHDQASARWVELWIGKDLIDRVDRRPEEIGFGGEHFRPFVERFGGKDGDRARRSARVRFGARAAGVEKRSSTSHSG